MDENTLAQARQELIRIGLIAYKHPLYQVLALRGPYRIHNRTLSRKAPITGPNLQTARGGCIMIDYELFSKIKHLKEHEGLTGSQIAAELALDPRTVGKWLAQGQFRPRKAAARPSKLDPFKNDIVRMLEAHAYTAAQVLQRIVELGFDGGYTIVKGLCAQSPAAKDPGLSQALVRPGRVRPGRLGLIRFGQRGLHPPQAQLLCHGPVLQPHDVRGVYRLSNHGTLFGLSSERL